MSIEEGIDVKTVASVLGHANTAITLNTYASADAEAKRSAAERLERVYGRRAKVERLEAKTGTEG